MERQRDASAADQDVGRESRSSIKGMLRRAALTATFLAASAALTARAQDIRSAHIEDTYANMYLSTFGSRASGGAVNQVEAGVGADDGTYAFIWLNYDTKWGVTEIDYSYMLNRGISKGASAGVGVQAFTFPGGKVYDRAVYCLTVEATGPIGPINGDATVWHLLNGKQGIKGNFVNLVLSKDMGLGEVLGNRLAVTPSLKVAGGSEFLGFDQGVLYLAPGVGVSIGNVTLSTRFQEGIGQVKDEVYVGVTVGFDR